MIDEEIKRRGNLASFLSATGSVASLIALALVLTEKVADDRINDPQITVWQITLGLLCLLAMGAVVVLTWDYVSRTVASAVLDLRAKTIRASLATAVGLLLSAVFVDGLYAAIHWRWWLGGVAHGIASVVSAPKPSADQIGFVSTVTDILTRETVQRLTVAGAPISVDTELVDSLGSAATESVEGFFVAVRDVARFSRMAPYPLTLTAEVRSRDFVPEIFISGDRRGLVRGDRMADGNGATAHFIISVGDRRVTRIAVTSSEPLKAGKYTLRVRRE